MLYAWHPFLKEDIMADYTPRLSIVLTEEQAEGLRKYIPWGLRRTLFTRMIDDLLAFIKLDDTGKIIAGIVSGKVKFVPVMEDENGSNADKKIH